MRGTTASRTPVVPGREPGIEIDEVGVADEVADAGVATAPREHRTVEWSEHVDVLRATGPDRADRIGVVGWNTAANRVSVPSTISSKTMSALFSPDWGRARGWLSIFTTSAGRARISSAELTGSPVSGILTTSGNVVVVLVDRCRRVDVVVDRATVVVDAGVVVEVVVGLTLVVVELGIAAG